MVLIGSSIFCPPPPYTVSGLEKWLIPKVLIVQACGSPDPC